MHLCKEGMGLALLPEDLGVAVPNLQRAVEAFGSPVRIPVCLVSRQDLRTGVSVRRAFDFLADTLNRQLPSDERAQP